MSDSPPHSRAWLVALILVSVLSCAYVLTHKLHSLPNEVTVVEGRLENCIRVDSEHGEFNGWFSPEIVYDVYVRTSDGRELVLWATPDTAFYRERSGDLVRVPVSDLEDGPRVRAYVGKVDHSGYRPAAFAVRVVAHD